MKFFELAIVSPSPKRPKISFVNFGAGFGTLFATIYLLRKVADGLGFEPRQADPEPAVLPLHYPSKNTMYFLSAFC